MISGHPTSISLEDAFWTALKTTSKHKGLSVAALAAEIDARRGAANLSSAIRVFLLETAQGQA
jgi:predicted DNA-binding ribbon-helix-helix protein